MNFNYTFKNADNEKEIENFTGIQIYSTPEIEGIGGIYKDNFKDFIVKEITESGQILEIKEDRESPSYSEKKDKFTNFNLIKINKDTFNALKEIRRALHIPKEHIFYSGLKDKCSISVQKISIRGNYIKELKKLKLRDTFIRSIYPSKKPVMLGSNRGNNFSITIRNIENKENLEFKINQIFDILSKKGIPNFFGLQRFGTYRPNSHLIGRFLLEGDYESAFKEFVSNTYSTENIELSKIRNNIGLSLNTPEALQQLYREFPKSLSYESKLIYHIINNPNDFEGAFKRLNPNVLNLIVNAFQSYIFNKMLSLRVKKGISLFNPIEGDRVCILDDTKGNITNVSYIFGESYDQFLKKAIELDKAVIVAPIVGYHTDLSEFPLMEDIFQKIIDEEGISSEIFQSEFFEKFKMKGSYRAITIKPIGLKIIKIVEDEIYPENKKLKFEFSLNKGSYATMLLRELIKST
ncbi:MAG: tRNA pseudouridine(13) synthase TruD [Candidatus Lokiarchaeota archaeon]|nr:tRNA pseudouridine(13) synthase TruD [Candidatus Lokiarchaeota archaeon]